MADYENIELRSEKVRNIIGKVPPELVREGTGFIAVILLALALAAFFIPYPENIKAKMTVTSTKYTNVDAEALIPYHYITKIKKGMKAHVEMEGYIANRYGYRDGTIKETEDSVIIINGEHYFRAILEIKSPFRHTIKKDMNGFAFILLSDKTIFQYILDK